MLTPELESGSRISSDVEGSLAGTRARRWGPSAEIDHALGSLGAAPCSSPPSASPTSTDQTNGSVSGYGRERVAPIVAGDAAAHRQRVSLRVVTLGKLTLSLQEVKLFPLTEVLQVLAP